MTTHAVATLSDQIGTPAFTLVANTVDTVQFDRDINGFEIISDGAAVIWYTVDGSTPAVDGDRSYYLPAAACVDRRDPHSGAATVIKLLSPGTPTVRVQVA
jgi:hypothetical protein